MCDSGTILEDNLFKVSFLFAGVTDNKEFTFFLSSHEILHSFSKIHSKNHAKFVPQINKRMLFICNILVVNRCVTHTVRVQP